MSQEVSFQPLTGRHVCGNCGVSFDGSQVAPIRDFFARVEPGGMVPSGECRMCGALCYPAKKQKKTEEGDNAGKMPSEGVHEERGDP